MAKKKLKRIMFISNTRLQYTNILMSMLLSLIEMGYYVKEIDVLQHPGMVSNPNRYQGGHGPVEIKYASIQGEITAFKPQMIILAAGGLAFTEETSQHLRQKGIILLGVTLSDPDVFSTAKNYINRFSHHTTNSKVALSKYHDLGFKNTHYLPFGIDSRFFVPTEFVPEYHCDVTIIGHYQPSRLLLTNALKERFDTKVYGNKWPYDNVKPVAYPEWLKVVHSGKILVDFPRTRAGYNNIKVRLFEGAAAGTLMITEYLDEIGEFFDYGREIVGYTGNDELFEQIQYYLDHPSERAQIAKNAQLKCAKDHMWNNRFAGLFKKLGLT